MCVVCGYAVEGCVLEDTPESVRRLYSRSIIAGGVGSHPLALAEVFVVLGSASEESLGGHQRYPSRISARSRAARDFANLQSFPS